MNIHPAFVHFPIALLTFYSLVELLPLVQFFPKVAWTQIKHFLLYAGTLSILPAMVTGLMAAQMDGENVVLPFHRAGAFTILVLFSIASFLALWNHFRPFTHQKLLRGFQKLLATLGLIALIVQGALGAAMVYGYHADPITSFVSSFFGFHH